MDLGRAELIRFLALRPPFDGLDRDALAEVAAGIELEFHPSGAPILTEDGGPVTFLRVIHAGAVSIVHDGRLLDLLSQGDYFGHEGMMAGMAPGFEARALEDTLCYRIPAACAQPLLEQARRRDLARRSERPGQQPVASLMHSAAVLCGPGESIAEVAAQMTRAGVDAALVELAGDDRPDAGNNALAGHLGIVTDRDLRSRVIAAGLSPDEPISAIMTTPVFWVSPERRGAEVMFELLERGLHHAPVLTRSGRVLGMVSESELFGARQRSWFGVRRQIGAAADRDGLAAAARLINPILSELHAARMEALEIARVLTALTDALVIRALELAGPAGSAPGTHPLDPGDAGLIWVALGSHARRELTPASTPLGAVIAETAPAPGWTTSAGRLLAPCGLPSAVIVASSGDWSAADPHDARATLVLSDRRPLYGTLAAALPTVTGAGRERLLASLARASREAAVPTGFAPDSVLSDDGGRSDRVDIHAAAVAPIQAVARWSGAAAGMSDGSTAQRLAAGAAAGRLQDADAQALIDAFGAAFELRMSHQMEQIAAGRHPDDMIAADELSPLTRSRLREIFRTLGAVGRRLP